MNLTCPICDHETATVTYHDEYQGEHPHGGMVTFLDECYCSNKCELTDEQITNLFEYACEHPYEPEYDHDDE